MSRRYRRIVGVTNEVLDAVNDYIMFSRDGRDIPDGLSEFLREQGFLEDCDFEGCGDCERVLFRTEGTLRDVNGESLGERHIWHCECGRRHVHHISSNTWTCPS